MNHAQSNIPMYRSVRTDTAKKEMTDIEFDRIFEKYYKRVYKYICYRIKDQYMAEDLCSKVFEKVIVKYNTYSPEKSPFEVWLFAIARNIITDYHRSMKKGSHFSLDSLLDMVSFNSSPEEEIISKEENRDLFQALSQLREKERNIIALKFGAALKNSEIAELVGISSSNVGVVIYRSLKKLRKRLNVGGNEHE